MKVMNALQESNAMYVMVEDFINNTFSMDLELYFDVDNYPCDEGILCRGKTSPSANGYSITLHENFVKNASSIAVSKTMLHEAIHAHLGYYVKSIKNNDNIDINDFPGILDYFTRFGNDNWQHEQMAGHYRGVIKQGMRDFDMLTGGYHSNEFYEALSWGGLKGTQSWNSLNSSKKQDIEDVISEEDTKGGCQ